MRTTFGAAKRQRARQKSQGERPVGAKGLAPGGRKGISLGSGGAERAEKARVHQKIFPLAPTVILSDLGALWSRYGGKSTFWSFKNVKNKEIEVCTE